MTSCSLSLLMVGIMLIFPWIYDSIVLIQCPRMDSFNTGRNTYISLIPVVGYNKTSMQWYLSDLKFAFMQR